MHKRITFGLFFLAAVTSSPRLLIAQTTDWPQALVIDDHDPRCQFEGGIRFDGVAREATVNDSITASQAADARVIWKPGVAGRYYVQVHWQMHMGYHEQHALYTVKPADTNPRQFVVDQGLTAAGSALAIPAENFMASGWYTLSGGPLLLDNNSTIELTKQSSGTRWLVADAIRIGKDLIVDELSAAAFYPEGTWQLRATQDPGLENTQISLSESTSAQMRLVPGVTGQHRVAISWAADPKNTSRAEYLFDLDGNPDTTGDQTTINIDQRLLADQTTSGSDLTWSGWYELSTPLLLQRASTLTLRNAIGAGHLVADGLKLCAVDDPPSEAPISLPQRESPKDLPRGAVEDPQQLAETIRGFEPADGNDAALEPLRIDQVSLDGRLGRRHRANADYLLWLLAENEEFMLDPYRLRDKRIRECEWDGEYAGKWLDAAVLTAANLDHVKLHEKLVGLSRAVRDEQDSDGCVGTEGPLRRGRNQWGTWMPWYMITGWLDQYEQYGERAALVAAWRAARWIVDYYGPIRAENRRFYEQATMEGGSNVALVDQLCRLYRHTGDDKILQFARDAVRQFPRFAEMKHTGQAPNVHVYVFLADLGAAVQLAVLENDQKQLAWLEQVWEEIHEKYLYPTGSLSLKEQLVTPTDEPNGHHQETCATVEWLLFCHRLYLTTGKARYQHAIDDAVYNALLGAQSTDGQKWMYFTPLRYEKKWFSGGTRCCYHSGPRGIARLPLMVYSTEGDGVRVDLFEASIAQLEVSGVPLRIEQQTNFPSEGDITVLLQPERPTEFTLRIRIPEWVRSALLTFNGEPLPLRDTADRYITVRRVFAPGDRLNLRLDMPVRLRAMKDAGVAIVRGPEVLSIDSRDNPDLSLDDVSIPEPVELETAEPDGDRRRYRAELLVDGKLRTVLLTPFADAGNHDARFRTVFPPVATDTTGEIGNDDSK